MKKISIIILMIVLGVLTFLYIRCTKVNTDQPCGTYGTNSQLFKDADNRCYYIDNSHTKVYVDKSVCNCY